MKRPNFFIVGAPRCGTTSMARYLATHPDVFISDPKEPCFFNEDMAFRNVTNMDEYERLFMSADREVVVGEASPLYLYSDAALPNIRRYASEARILVMLRDPISMAQSWHAELLLGQRENVPDFERAWSLQQERHEGKAIPPGSRDHSLLQYGEICRLGEQIERVFDVFPRHQVKVILLDDLKADPRGTYLRVLEFLDVEDDGRDEFPVHNRRKMLRSRTIQSALKGVGSLVRQVGLPTRTGLLAPFYAMNRKPRQHPPPREEFLEKVRHHFAEDVEVLSALIERDLGHWLTGKHRAGF